MSMNFMGLGSLEIISIPAYSTVLIIDIEDMDPDFDVPGYVKALVAKMPLDIKPDNIAYHVRQGEEPDERGMLEFTPDWNGAIQTGILTARVDATPSNRAVLCSVKTKKGLGCRNMTRDETGRCWRHRDQHVQV